MSLCALTAVLGHTSLTPASAYIDPGTGSMLFTLAVGLASAGYFLLRNVAIKAKFLLSGGRGARDAERHPIVIYSDDKRYWNVFEPICDELERRGVEACYWTQSPDDPALSKGYEHVRCEFIGEGNRGFARLNMMSADVCLSTTPGLDVYQWKRSKGVGWYVHVLHATSTAAWYRMFGLDGFDAVLLSNDYQVGEVRELEGKRGLPPKELEVVGCAYMDSMVSRLESEDADEGGETGAHAPTVLLAPSWGPIGLLSRYGEAIIDALVSTGYDVIIRPHPQSMASERELVERLMARYPEGERLSWNFDRDNFDVLRRSDVMLSDMSGVIHDFALVFDKPVMYATGGIDTSVYDAAWLDEPFWETPLFTDTGIPIEEGQFPRMREVIDGLLADGSVRERRRHARDAAWAHQGECAARVADYLVARAAKGGYGGRAT